MREGSSRFDKAYYEQIRRQYPQQVSKEQLCKLCHISKRVAKAYLDSGVIPCQNSGRATHKYSIQTEDVIAFLKARRVSPDGYRIDDSVDKPPAIVYNQEALSVYRGLLVDWLAEYPDLMTVTMIADCTGYSIKTVHLWAQTKHLRWFQDGTSYYAPKECVIDHLMSEQFHNIRGKSKRHCELLEQLYEMLKEGNHHE